MSELFELPQKTELHPPDQRVKLKKATGINDFIDMKFDDYDFTDHWLAMFGKPEKNFRMLIYGPEKNGKTDFTIKLCKYISTFGKVYYNSHEEGKSKTLQSTFIRNDMHEASGRIMLLHKEPLQDLILRLKQKGSPRFVVIDSLDYMEISDKDYKLLVDTFPRKAFILICWTDTKDLPLLNSAKMIAKRVDIKVQVKNRTAYPLSRFATEEGGNKPWQFGPSIKSTETQPTLF